MFLAIRFIYLSLAILLWPLPSNIFSQTEILEFTSINEDQGINDLRFNSFVFKDSYGFWWIGSMRGCYRFDGNQAQHYSISEDGTFSEGVQSNFFEDTIGNLWFTTYQGLHCYRRATDQIENHKIKLAGTELILGYHAFYLDTINSKLWLKADSIVLTYDLKNSTSEFQFNSNSLRFLVYRSTDGHPINILAFPWLKSKGFHRYTNDKNGNWEKESFQSGKLKNSEISKGIVQDSTLWLMSNIGLIKVDLNSFIPETIHYPPRKVHQHFTDGVLHEKNQIILTSKDNGLWSFNIQDEIFTQNWTITNSQDALASNELAEINIDRSNGLWITLPQHGLAFGNYKRNIFSNPLAYLDFPIFIRQIIEDEDKNIWVLTKEKGIYVFDFNQKLKQHFSNINQIPLFPNSQLSIDHNGKVWLLNKNLVFQYLDANWQLIHKSKERLFHLVPNFSESPLLISANGAFDLHTQGEKNALIRNQALEAFQQFELLEIYMTEGKYNFAPIESKDLLVIESVNNSTEIIERLTIPAITHTVQFNTFSNSYWIGTDKGLLLYKKGHELDLVLDKKDLGNKTAIFDIIQTTQDSLFLFSENGIYLFNIATNDLIRFGKHDGISANMFNKSACLMTSNGMIWAGNSKGLSVFDPNQIKSDKDRLTPYIKELWLNDENFKQSNQLNVNQLNHIPASYGSNLKLSISAKGAFHSEKIKINYRLDSYDKSWTTTASGLPIRYANLQAGNHEMLIQVINEHNLAGPIKKVKIKIEPPFWQKAWFWIIIVLIGILVISSILRFYYNRKLRRQEAKIAKERLIHNERERIANELHDDLGGELSSILFLSEGYPLLSEKDQLEQIQRISKLSKNALNNMRDIIWILDDSQDNLQDLAAWIQEFSISFFHPHNIKVSIDNPSQNWPNKKMRSEIRRNIILILKESFNNILKHSQTESVNLSMSISSNKFAIKIQDNGIGFEINTIKHMGHGLNNMKKRAKIIGSIFQITSTVHKGTAIALTVPLEPKF